MKIRRVFYLRESPFFTDKIGDIRLIEHSLRDALFDPSNNYERDIQPVCRRQCVDMHGWGYRRLK